MDEGVICSVFPASGNFCCKKKKTLAVDQSEQSGQAYQSEHTGLIRRQGLKTEAFIEHFIQKVNTNVQYEEKTEVWKSVLLDLKIK